MTSHPLSRQRGLVAASGLTASLLIGAAILVVMTPNTQPSSAHRAAAAAAAVKPVAQVLPSLIDPSAAADAEKYQQLTLVNASDADALSLPTASITGALQTADSFGSDGTLSRVSLARATKAGTENASQSSGLRIDNQLVWVFEYANASQHVFGPMGYTGPATVKGTLLILIDAVGGNFVASVSN